MPDTGPMDRYLPCLLDRLTDEEPHAAQESREKRAMSLRRYREGVLRDLQWLLNARAHGERETIAAYPHVRSSVLNYGIPDFCGLTSSGANLAEMERTLRDAIRSFEPRVLADSLTVRVAAREAAEHNAIAFEIHGVLWAQPLPQRLDVRTEIDLETGECQVKDRPNG